MSTTKYTPGPWHIVDEDDNSLLVTSEYREAELQTDIAEISVGYDEPFNSEQQANARLIASAPDLVKALDRAYLGLLRIPVSVLRVELQEELSLCRDALAKALGKSSEETQNAYEDLANAAALARAGVQQS